MSHICGFVFKNKTMGQDRGPDHVVNNIFYIFDIISVFDEQRMEKSVIELICSEFKKKSIFNQIVLHLKAKLCI